MLPQPSVLAGGGDMGALMRAHDWSGSPLGPPAGWPQSLRSVVGLMLHSRFPMFVAWGPALAFLYNDGYRPILGARHPAALGLPFRQVWPEIWDDILPFIGRALAGEATWHENLPLVMHRNGYPEDTWYTFSYSPVHDEAGAVAGMFCTCTETTAKVLADRAQAFLLGLEEHLRAMDDPRAVTAVAAEMLGRHLGAGRVGFVEVDPAGEFFTVGHDWTDGVMPPLAGRHRLDDFGPDLIRDQREGRVVRIDDALADPRAAGGAFAAIGIRAGIGVPLRRADRFAAALYAHQAGPRRWRDDEVALVRDVAERTWSALERARAEAALRDSEARFRNMADHAPVMVWTTGPDGRCTYLNRLWYETTGQTAADAEGFGWLDATHPEDRPGAEAAFLAANAAAAPFRAEYRLRRADGTHRWALDTAAPRLAADGTFLGYIGSVIDIAERREAEERMRLGEERLRLALEAGALGDWELDVPRNVARRSPRHDAIFGHPGGAPDWSYDSFLSHVLPEDRPAVDQAFREAVANGTVWHVEARIRRANDDALRWIEVWGDPRGDAVMHGLVADITARKTAEAAVREGEERLRYALEAGRLGAWQLDLRTLALDSSATFRMSFGRVAEAPFGYDDLRSVIHPEDRARMEEVIARAVAARADYDIEYRVVRPDGEARWVQIRGRPAYAADGTPLRMAGISLDVTERKSAEAALLAAEERLRLAQESTRLGLFDWDLLGGTIEHDARLRELLAVPPDLPVTFADIERQVHPDDRAPLRAAVSAACEPGGDGLVDIEYRIGEGAAARWRAGSGRVVFAGGRAVRMVGTVRDIHDRRSAETALREGDARLRALVEVSAQVVWTMDGKGNAFEDSPSWRAFTGQTLAETQGRGWQDAIHPEDRERVHPLWRAALLARAPFEVEYRLRHHAGGHRWTLVRGTPLLDADGSLRMWVGMNTDIEERKRAEARTLLLTREVDHRAKNALAVVQAALRLTRASDQKSFVRAVEGRIAALARAQTLLARDRWEGADLEALLRGELAPFTGDGAGPRVELAGPPVTLPPGAAQPLSMAVHELATNAVKYGALSVPDGRVALSWSLDRGAGRPDSLRLRWVEAGGPSVESAPSRRGFGSRILEETVRRQLGGAVEQEWRQQGLHCRLSLPLREVPGPVSAETPLDQP